MSRRLPRKRVILLAGPAPGENLGPGNTTVALAFCDSRGGGVEFRQVYVVLHHRMAFLLWLRDPRITRVSLLMGVYRTGARSIPIADPNADADLHLP